MSDPIPALTVSGLEKSYRPGIPVLRDFDFELLRGEIHALVGSNGAGKSTLAKVLTGLTPVEAGELQLSGETYAPHSKRDAARQGVVLVLQELNLLPTLTVGENLFLPNLPHDLGVLRRADLANRAREALKRVGLEQLHPDCLAGSLGVGRQQLVEIAGALAQRSCILILDEPTAALTGPEIDLLFGNLERLRSEGVSIIYISHRMDEIARIADRVTVLRDGRCISTHAPERITTRELVREMAGDEIADRGGHAEAPASRGDLALEVKNLCAGSVVRGVSFQLRCGEILGIAGLIGSGRTETLRALVGADPLDAGHIHRPDRMERGAFRSPAEAVRAGLALLPEDRKRDGLLLRQSITVNTTLPNLSRYARRGLVDSERETGATRRVCDRLQVQRASLERPVAELSGGNQQKVVVGRWLQQGASVLLFDEPTRGIDVSAKETLYQLLDELAAEGKAILVVSSDLRELLGLCHRILVMSAGRITGEFHPGSWSEEAITAAAFRGYLDEREAP